MDGPFYVDPAAAGSATGADWTNAWTTLQTALDTAVAGEIIYCRGTQTLSGAALDVDTNAGTNAGGWIKVIGCNASGNVDGTRFVVDANGGSHHVFAFTNTADMYWFENIEAKNTAAGSYDGFIGTAASSLGCVFINCCANTCGRYGFNSRFDASLFYRCVAYSNGSTGFYSLQYSVNLLLCCSRDNTDGGFISNLGPHYGCIAHGNGNDGISPLPRTDTSNLLVNCVVDGNVDDGILTQGFTTLCFQIVFGCRITNHSGSGDIGLNCNSEPTVSGFNYFEDNDGDNIQNATLHQFIPLEGGSSTSNLEDLANTNEGYVDKTNHDFSTGYTDSGDPDLRRTAITIPWS